MKHALITWAGARRVITHRTGTTFVHLWPWPAPVAAQLLAYALLTVYKFGSEPLTLTYGTTVSMMRVRPCDERCKMLAA